MKIVLLMLLVLRQGAGSSVWSVTFADPDLCAATGSSVEFQCSYDYPDGQTVRRATWSKGQKTDVHWTRVELSLLPEYDNRSEYVGDLQHDCRLALTELKESDSGYYYFRFDTDTYGWRSRNSVYLNVTDLKATVHPALVETGSNVTLQCSSLCEHLEVVWFKDGEPRSQADFQAFSQDSGNYSCALKGQESARSEPVELDVQYRPVNVSISTHPTHVVVGGSVNLTCSSDSNPPADSYTWYRKTHPAGSMEQAGSGQLLQVLPVEATHRGPYLCQAGNQLGEGNSTELLLPVEDVAGIDSSILLISLGLKILTIISLTLVLISACYRWRRNTPLEVREEIIQDNEYVYVMIS